MTRATPDGLNAAIAGADYLRSLCRPNIENISLDCSLSDADGGVIAGGGIVPGITEVRTIAMTRLPWTIQLSASPFPGPSAKKPTLMAIAVVLILVWVTGAVFIARVIRREIRVNRLQSDFVAAVSHEFRSPLTSISQISEMLSSGRWTNDDARRQSYDMLGLEADRLRRLVEGLLDFQKFESESAVYQFESVELGSFLYAVVSDFQAHVANRGYRIEVKNAGADLHVRADRDALALAVWNLLDNAVKYSPDCRTVWVDLEHVGNNIIVAVRDRGLGIPAKEQRAIFEKFVRGAESKARRIKGTGIGLALVRRIVQAHGGEIRVSSQPGDGSRFAVVLPEGAGS
jgi:signal transduction histidine kinase